MKNISNIIENMAITEVKRDFKRNKRKYYNDNGKLSASANKAIQNYVNQLNISCQFYSKDFYYYYRSHRPILKCRIKYLVEHYIDDHSEIKLNHNFNNIMFAVTVAKIMNLDLKKANEDIYNFAPLEHRMEFVGEIDGVKYYNDSIATIPASTINGVETLKNVNTLIIGGKDRGIDYSEFAEFLGNTDIEHLICLPDTGWKIADMVVNENMEKFIVHDMEEAVRFAKRITKKGTSCLLSPAASSYGFFKNFKERGNLFKKFVFSNVSAKLLNIFQLTKFIPYKKAEKRRKGLRENIKTLQSYHLTILHGVFS